MAYGTALMNGSRLYSCLNYEFWKEKQRIQILGCDYSNTKFVNRDTRFTTTKSLTPAEVTRLSSSAAMDNSLQIISYLLSLIGFHVFRFLVLDWGFLLIFLWLNVTGAGMTLMASADFALLTPLLIPSKNKTCTCAF